jgi:hypothetical protein
LQYRASGLIKTDTEQSLPDRLAHIHRELARVIEEHKPEAAAVEETFVNQNPASALKLGQARGVALSVPALYGLETAEYAANKVKKIHRRLRPRGQKPDRYDDPEVAASLWQNQRRRGRRPCGGDMSCAL